MGTTSHFCWILQHQEETIFSLCWPLILLHHVLNGFLFSSSHGFAISVRFQLTFFTRSRWAGPFFSPFPANRFQEALDPDNCPLPCQAQCNCNDSAVSLISLIWLYRLQKLSFWNKELDCPGPICFTQRCHSHCGVTSNSNIRANLTVYA